MKKTLFVRDLKESKIPIESIFLVKYSAVANGKNGKPYMNLVLMDQSGEVEAKIWEDVASLVGQVVKDAIVKVEAKCQTYQGRKQLVIQKIELIREDEVILKDLLPKAPVDADSLYEELLRFVSSMKDPHYRALAESILKDDPQIVAKVKKAPAAKSMHHAYPAGLIEHVVSITKTLDFLASHYQPFVDRDLLFLGGFFHDIGKLWELSYDRVTDYTTEGKLIGHLVMGVELIERKIQELSAQPGRLPFPFPEEKKLLIKHIILSHHGQLDYGSPKRPKCLEALIVHMIDDLDSKVNAIRVFTQSDSSPGRWTGLNRQFERFFFKPDWAMQVSAAEEPGDPNELRS